MVGLLSKTNNGMALAIVINGRIHGLPQENTLEIQFNFFIKFIKSQKTIISHSLELVRKASYF
ncbi:hypothetical protein B1F79_00560 [Coxiella-like endosymbiont of Rhipicephalus sanguineus]|nr:hypothetical protein [Coxiella-like endosymbiont of Rhipicephalus sanguineus]